MDMKTAVIYRLEELIRQNDITVNEAAIRSGVPPSTLKNILYMQEWGEYTSDFALEVFAGDHFFMGNLQVES